MPSMRTASSPGRNPLSGLPSSLPVSAKPVPRRGLGNEPQPQERVQAGSQGDLSKPPNYPGPYLFHFYYFFFFLIHKAKLIRPDSR